jgi:hypothetical protein
MCPRLDIFRCDLARQRVERQSRFEFRPRSGERAQRTAPDGSRVPGLATRKKAIRLEARVHAYLGSGGKGFVRCLGRLNCRRNSRFPSWEKDVAGDHDSAVGTKQPRSVIDTSVLVAGVAGFQSWRSVQTPSASFLRDWVEVGTFTWRVRASRGPPLVREEILSEYKGVLSRLGVRRNLVGKIINRQREEVEFVILRSEDNLSPDRTTTIFCACAEQGRAFICHVEQEAFPPKEPDCQGDFAR